MSDKCKKEVVIRVIEKFNLLSERNQGYIEGRMDEILKGKFPDLDFPEKPGGRKTA